MDRFQNGDRWQVRRRFLSGLPIPMGAAPELDHSASSKKKNYRRSNGPGYGHS
jgi:hypothetical protein